MGFAPPASRRVCLYRGAEAPERTGPILQLGGVRRICQVATFTVNIGELF
jgi:hypothetical protein